MKAKSRLIAAVDSADCPILFISLSKTKDQDKINQAEATEQKNKQDWYSVIYVLDLSKL
jgi:hypothetical protein